MVDGPPDPFVLGTPAFAFQAAFFRCQRRPGLSADYRLLSGAADQLYKPGSCIFAVTGLGTEPPGFDDKDPVRGYPVAGQRNEALPNFLGQRTRVSRVKTELNRGGDFVDVLPARP